MTKIERLQKYAAGGKVVKLQMGGSSYNYSPERKDDPNSADYYLYRNKNLLPGQAKAFAERAARGESIRPSEFMDMTMPTDEEVYADIAERDQLQAQNLDVETTPTRIPTPGIEIGQPKPVSAQEVLQNANPALKQTVTNTAVKPKTNLDGLSATGQAALGMTSQIGSEIIQGVDQATMGDKNFSASSQAIDAGVHGISSKLMKSGNPYSAAAGLALEGLNFVTKAAGKNVQGYDVNINNSGYGNLGHMESEAGRVWDSWSGATARKLRKRNEQARIALAASEISEDISYEQEARTNSVTNVLQQNQIALAGGIDSSLLGN